VWAVQGSPCSPHSWPGLKGSTLGPFFFGHMRLVSETRLFGFQFLLNAQARRLSASWRRWIMAAEKPEQNGKQKATSCEALNVQCCV